MRAMKRLELISLPLRSTMADLQAGSCDVLASGHEQACTLTKHHAGVLDRTNLSTSVSNTMPKSALAAVVALAPAAMAEGCSGLQMWLGKEPSGSRNWEPVMSAPRGASTCV